MYKFFVDLSLVGPFNSSTMFRCSLLNNQNITSVTFWSVKAERAHSLPAPSSGVVD